MTTTLITGGNRGLGFEAGRQLAALGHTVLLGSRSEEAGRVAAAELGPNVHAVSLDVLDDASVEAAVHRVEADHGGLDVLINNAAINYDPEATVLDVDLDQVRSAFETNVIGVVRVTQAFAPLLRRSDHPRIVNVSSGLSQLTAMDGGIPAYRTSKAALNALTRMLSHELAADNCLVNSVGPGWAATDMGGPGGGPIPPCAARIVAAATLPDDGPTGTFLLEGAEAPW